MPIPPGHDLHTDFGDAPPWDDRVLVVAFDENVTVDPGGAVRRYEAFLPAPGSSDRAGLALATSLAEPMAYALVGVTAADDRTHTPDHRGDPDRFGNESGIGGPATASVLANAQSPLLGLGLAFAVVHLAVPLGVWWALALGLATSFGWSAMLLGLRKARRS